MARYSLKRFASPGALKVIQERNLVALLEPYAEYFRHRGVEVVSYDGAGLDYEGLARVLISPDEQTPGKLVDDLYFIHELSTPESMDELFEAIEQLPANERPNLSFSEEPTPADVAVQLRLTQPDLLERKHAERKLTSRRSFEYYRCPEDADWDFRMPTADTLRKLEHALDDRLEQLNRGRNSRVFIFQRPDGIWFLVRHGEPCTRQPIIEEEDSSSVFYRPERYDVLKYDPLLGELSMNAETKKIGTLYRAAFGEHLFDNPQQFPSDGKYTLEPLRTDGEDALACTDVEGMDWVSLKEIQFYWGGKHGEIEVRKAKDVFAAFKDRARELPAKARILRASFLVKFAENKTPRTVSVAPPNVASYSRDADAVVVEQWLQRRGFSLGTGGPDAPAYAAVANA